MFFHDVAVQPLESLSVFCFVLCVCFFFCRCLVSYGPSNLLLRPPTLSLWPLSICGTFLVVGLPVALRAGASTLLGWMLSYPVSRVGVGIAAACCLLLLAVAWASKLRC